MLINWRFADHLAVTDRAVIIERVEGARLDEVPADRLRFAAVRVQRLLRLPGIVDNLLLRQLLQVLLFWFIWLE